MRYAQRGGYRRAEQQRREGLRLEAAGRFARGDRVSEIAHDLRVTPGSVRRWHRAWQDGGAEALCYRPIYLGTDRCSTATLFRDGLPRAGLPAFRITKTPEAACVQATVSEWPSRPDVAAVAAITERD